VIAVAFWRNSILYPLTSVETQTGVKLYGCLVGSDLVSPIEIEFINVSPDCISPTGVVIAKIFIEFGLNLLAKKANGVVEINLKHFLSLLLKKISQPLLLKKIGQQISQPHNLAIMLVRR